MTNVMEEHAGYITSQQLNDILKNGEAIEDFAYQQGWHECGFSPIKRLYTVFLHLSASYDQMKDDRDRLFMERSEQRELDKRESIE